MNLDYRFAAHAIRQGYTTESVLAAVKANDLALLEHAGDARIHGIPSP